MDDKGVCKDCNNRKYCEDYKPNKWQCEDYEREHTNEEWLEMASTEEKADWLFQHMDCIGCPASKSKCHQYYDACKEVLLDWLKEKHHDSVQG